VTKIRLLLVKDLRVLGRSPALVAALVLYPLVFAVLVGLVVRYASDQPRVAFVDRDRLPETLTVGGQRFNVPRVISEVQGSVDLVPLEEAEADQHGKRVAGRAGDAGEREEPEPGEQNGPPPPAVGDGAADDLPQREAQEEDAQRQLRRRDAGVERLLQLRHGRQAHVDGEGRERGQRRQQRR